MRFAIVLAKVLCALITAAVLTAFVYYVAVSPATELSAPINPVTISFVLLVAALMAWAVVSMIGDISNYKIDRKTIKEALSHNKQTPVFDTDKTQPDFSAALSALTENNQQALSDGLQSITAKLDNFSSENSASAYKITSAIAALSEKLIAAPTNQNSVAAVASSGDLPTDLADTLRQICSDLSDLRAQTAANFAAIKAQLFQQERIIENISLPGASTASTASNYSQLTEETDYPESVIGYNEPTAQNIINEPIPEPENISLNEVENSAEPKEDSDIIELEPEQILSETNSQENAMNARLSSETETQPEPVNTDIEVNQEDEVQTLSNQEIITETSEPETTDIPLEDFMAQTVEDHSDTPVDLNIPAEEMPYDEPTKVDLGADDPFGAVPEEAPVDLNIPAEEVAYDEPVKVDLGADDPFGASVATDDVIQKDIAETQDASNAPIGLRSPFDDRNIIDEDSIDLGADDPFGTATDFADPFAGPLAAPENLDELGADDPFGFATAENSSETKDNSSVSDVFDDLDINNFSSTDDERNEPRLDKIFNDNLASELAELEILQDNPQDEKAKKENEDNDLEQFFASHR